MSAETPAPGLRLSGLIINRRLKDSLGCGLYSPAKRSIRLSVFPQGDAGSDGYIKQPLAILGSSTTADDLAPGPGLRRGARGFKKPFYIRDSQGNGDPLFPHPYLRSLVNLL